MTDTSQKTSPAVAVAKEHRQRKDPGGIIDLSTGVRIRIKTVPPGLVEDVVAQIQDPPVPMFYDEDREREFPNPTDPQYIKDMTKAERDRSVAMIETIVLFGIELVDGLPEDEEWIRKLKFLDRRGVFDLSGYDLNDNLDKEFLFKRYICLGNAEDLTHIVASVQGVTPEDVDRARQTFLDDEEGKAN